MKHHIFSQISGNGFLALAFLAPLAFLPVFSEYFDTSKLFLTLIITLIVILCWAATTFLKKTISLTLSPLLLPVLVVAGTTVATAFIGTPYAYETFVGRGLLILSLCSLFIAATSVGRLTKMKSYLYTISISACLVSLLSIMQAMGFGVSTIFNNLFGLSLSTSPLFNVVGTLLAATAFMLPIMVMNIIELLTQTSRKLKFIHGVFSVIIAVGCVVNIYFMTPGQVGEPIFFPIQASWSIAADVLKTPSTALFGVGSESYGIAFTQFRPVSMNMSEIWNIRFSSGRIEPLHILTTGGVVGLISVGLLWLATLRLVLPIRAKTRPFAILLIGTLVFQLILPATIPQTIFFFVTLVALVLHLKNEKDPRVSEVMLHMFAVNLVSPDMGSTRSHRVSQTLSTIFSFALCAFVVFIGMFFSRVIRAEILFGQSVEAAAKNDGVQAYILQQQMVTLQPNSDRFRRAFASTSFLVAKAITEQRDAPDDQRAKVSPLLQQSIEQAKIATELDPRKVSNWETLASIYRGILNSVEGADQWTVAAVIRAIQVDPTNPTLRFELGNVYSSLQNYDQAIRLYQQAIELKPNWSNAYYNLSNAFKQKGDFKLAQETLQTTKQFIPSDSKDLSLIDKELADLEAKIKEQEKKMSKNTNSDANTTSQQNNGISLPEGQIRLPEELGLPEVKPPSSVPDSIEAPTTTPSPSPTP